MANKFGSSPPNGLNALDSLLGRIAALEADNQLMKQHIMALNQAMGHISISQEGLDGLSEYLRRDIAMRLFPLVAPVPAPPAAEQEAPPQEEPVAQPA